MKATCRRERHVQRAGFIGTIAEAHAHFRLGQALFRDGRTADAAAEFAEATRLHPDSWAMWRQTAEKDARGLAVGEAFWQRVDAPGDRRYYGHGLAFDVW